MVRFGSSCKWQKTYGFLMNFRSRPKGNEGLHWINSLAVTDEEILQIRIIWFHTEITNKAIYI